MVHCDQGAQWAHRLHAVGGWRLAVFFFQRQPSEVGGWRLAGFFFNASQVRLAVGGFSAACGV